MAIGTQFFGKRTSLWLAVGLVSAAAIGATNPALAQDAATVANAGADSAANADLNTGANPAAQLARAEDLKNEAFRALRAGEFDKSDELLNEAEAAGGDPKVATMRHWLTDYRTRISTDMIERRKQFDEALANVKKLSAANLETYAYNYAADAFLHAEDKDEFRSEAWVKEAIMRMGDMAVQAEKDGDLLGARRLYGNLSTIEILNPVWRAKINEVSRKLNLVAMYAPDSLEKIYKNETNERLKVLAIVDPEKAAIATTKPADDEMNDDFRIDWKQMLSGVKVDMLREALEDARQNYYRDTTFPQLVTGGVTGLSQFIETPGLTETFPSLGDPDRRQKFSDALEKIKADVAGDEGVKDNRIVGSTLSKVLDANRNSIAIPDEVIVYEFANGATSVLDPFTSVIWPYDLNEFQKSTQGNFIGVGIQIQNDEDGFLKVVSPLPDSPAYKAGIHADDIVTQINGKNAKGVTTIQAVKAITGPEGSPVKLTVRSPDGTEKEFNLKRASIKVASVKGWSQLPAGQWDWLVDQDNGIGYVRLTNFTKDSSAEIRNAVDQIKAEHGKAIILDLRHNPGGLLTAATEIADKFLHKGNIVSTRSAQNVATAPPVNARDSGDDTDLPTVVLVNQYSASASEIVSGALKDQKRALIVGERTFGKGSVQMLFPLEDKEAYLKLTTSHYYLPSGRCLHREEDSTEWGVDPDVTVEMTPEQMRTVLKMRQELDVIRDGSIPAKPTTLPAEFKSREEQLLASDPQLGAAVLMLRLQLLGAPVM